MFLRQAILWSFLLPNPLSGLQKDGISDKTYPLPVFAPNGKDIALTAGPSGEMAVLCDLATGTVIRKFNYGNERIHSLEFSPDGKYLAASHVAESWLWETATGKCVRRVQGWRCHFSPNGQIMVTGDYCKGPFSGPANDPWPFYLHVWDTETGKRLRSMPMPNAVVPKAFSPDGRHVAVDVTPDGIRIWDVKVGRQVQKLPKLETSLYSMAFSSDGRLLGTGEAGGKVTLWESKTGKKYRQWSYDHLPDRGISALAFSPGGDWLAWGGQVGDIHLGRIWDQASWVAGKDGRYVNSLAFSPDGKLIAVGSEDAIRIVEFLTGQEVQVLTGRNPKLARFYEKQLSPERMEILWQDLARQDAARAYEAIWSLVPAAPQSVAFLEKKLRPAKRLDPKRLSQLVRDLDSDIFRIRTQAAKELESLGDLAEPALRKALEENSSLELKRRVERIRKKAVGPMRHPEQLRDLRALKILEHIGSDDARKLIGLIAQGDLEAPLTWEARACLSRLKKSQH
jgi:WD40 repeat protein